MRMKILMLSSTFPYPPSRGATEGRTFNLIKYLSQRHSITLLTQRPPHVLEKHIAALRSHVDELVVFPLPPDPVPEKGIKGIVGKVSRFTESMVKGVPVNVLHRYCPEMQAWIDQHVQAGTFDVIDCEHSVNEIYIRPEFRRQIPTVVDVHSSIYGWTLNHLEMDASPHPLRDRLSLALLLERYEKSYCAKFSRIVVTTEDDRQQLLRLCPQAQIQIVSNGVDLETFTMRPQDPGGHRLIFIGAMNSSHNIDAACFFANEVLPQVQQQYPDVTFSIVGANPAPEVLALGERPGVEVTGRVPSITDYLHQSTVCVVPLRVGLGIKTKTLESMATGIPIVASDRGLEGLTVDGPDVPLRALRANQVEEYISAIHRLFEDSQLRTTLSHNCRAMIEADYTWDRAGQLYEQALMQAEISSNSAKVSAVVAN